MQRVYSDAPKKILEIACFNLESVLIAQEAGADRVELCQNYDAGGLTPSRELIQKVKKSIQIPVHVIIRPRASDFVYENDQVEKMERDILFCRENGIHGVVFGSLTKEKKIDLKACEILKKAAHTMSVTFHRAIDDCVDIEEGIRQLIDLGVQRVLTSGGKGNASDNFGKITELQLKFGNKITIMPGGGIRSSNLGELVRSGALEFHSSAITGSSEIADPLEIKSLKHILGKEV